MIATLTCLALLASSRGLPAQDSAVRDLPYVTGGAGHVRQKLDLHLPAKPSKAPVFVYVHGGSWRAGDKAQLGNFPRFFNERGWILASVNYRLSPEVKHPAHVQDVAAAVGWVKQNISEYGGDPSAIFVGGHSAGAHLSALLGTDERRLREAGLSFKDIRAIVGWDTAAYDLPPIVRFNAQPDSPYRQAFGDDPAGWEDASPLAFAPKAKAMPPYMAVLAGGAGINGKRASTLRLVEAIRKSGVRADFADASSFRDHGSLATEFGSAGDPVAPAVMSFLESVLKGDVKAPGKDVELKVQKAGSIESKDRRVGDPNTAYLDPEFLQSGHLACYADQSGRVWVAEIDPATGDFKPGKAFQVADNLSRWSRYSNGPEWGQDVSGPTLFFLRDDEDGKGQLWQVREPWVNPKPQQLTRHGDLHHWLAMSSVSAESSETRVIVYRGKPQGNENRNVWLSTGKPEQTHPFGERMGVARFAYGSGKITWAPRSPRSDPSKPAQVHLLDTDTGVVKVITDDAGEKIDPWLWNAPEFNGELLLAVNIDGSALGIYRETSSGKPWSRIVTLRLPKEAPHQQLKSVEPVNGGKGAFGRSYFTVQAGDDRDPDTSIWLFGFDQDGRHLVRRLDEGSTTGEKARRLDPESLIGSKELFVYYSLIGQGPAQLRLVQTGVKRK